MTRSRECQIADGKIKAIEQLLLLTMIGAFRGDLNKEEYLSDLYLHFDRLLKQWDEAYDPGPDAIRAANEVRDRVINDFHFATRRSRRKLPDPLITIDPLKPFNPLKLA